MFAKRYNADELIDIIAAPAYSPELIEYVKKVANAPYLSQFLSQKPKLGITGTIAKDYVSADTKDAVPYVSTKQVKGLHAYMDDAKYISKEADIEWAKCRVDDGDIIINKSGNVGAAAVLCCAPYKYVNSVSDIINIKLDKTASIDRDFLVVYLNSPYGQKQLQRLSGGAIFSHVSLHAIPDIRVYHSDIKAQKYIGDKVRQAEQLRAWAKRLEGMADSKIKDLFHFNIVDSLTLKPRRMKQQVLSAVSLAPEFARATDSQRTFRNSSKLSNFISKCKCGDPIKSEDRVPGPYFYYGASGPIDTHTEFNFNGKYLIIAQDGSIGCANVADGKFWANNHVWVLKVKDEYDIESICRFLDKHFPCWKGVTTGSVVPKVTSENLLNILIPIDVAKNREIGSKLRLAVTMAAYAKKLTASAKTLVEALIEGQLTEQQLINAQQALKDGDNSLDLAILSKLSAKGYAIEGATPLFSDVDELYSLLEDAEQAEAEE
ncbi:restriction endonuclease subunit S [Hafnia sp. HMSC23F03]|uniref:restriction endonuclease subunit S n=1 Tax=Hafnia sp. HMSC23F03 TaxID=1581059 RepID=UPI0008A35E9C|nr:restriction endonuclease subunit S [Hafnia sp. HMSC23F03]OFS08318.1 restriction endonuclease [Hafnia sp. HMSC23F03]